MDFKQIQELLKAVNKSTISELKVKDKDFEITIKQATAEGVATIVSAPAQYMQAPMPAPATPAATPAPAVAETAPAASTSTKGVEVKSPMIGTFYRSPSPDKPAFVQVGDEVSVGQTLCIIEAMKLFNEIESEVSGKVIKVLVDDASPVEYDQPLFIIE